MQIVSVCQTMFKRSSNEMVLQSLVFRLTLRTRIVPKNKLLDNTAWKIEFCEECASTNAALKEKRVAGEIADRTALMTYFQTNGRGQGKNAWHSAKGKNLLCSFYRQLELPVANHFMLNIATSLSLFKVLSSLHISTTIKWPNDIYVGNSKIAGILIENTLMRNLINETTIGIGLNVNETAFPDWLPNPCSIAGVCGNKYELKDLLTVILSELDIQLNQLGTASDELLQTYQSLLYRINSWHHFRINKKVEKGLILGVERDGRLIVEFNNGKLQRFLFGEIQYVI